MNGISLSSWASPRANRWRKSRLSSGFSPRAPACRGHFHAALFPYRPVQRGELNLDKVIGGLLATDSAQTLLHLLADDRQFEGIGQSEFMRGACWVGPIAEFLATAT